MPLTTLSSVVQANPAAINSNLEKLSCSACGIDEVDIYPAVLSALTAKGAPRGVAEEVRARLAVARQARPRVARRDAATAAPQHDARSRATCEDSYMESFNMGIAMTLHTVLLSRNRITNLIGIVQFRHCVRLSLVSNRIRTIEDCAPLSLLHDLQYLSLEFNPVAQLPHYRAHLLRICAWPHELSASTCRLRKLDSVAVNTAEVRHAAVRLRLELSMMPELLSRMQLLAFLDDVERKQSIHYELRQRGVVVQQTAEKVTLEATLERGAAYALERVPVSGAAHLVRLLVRDRHRLVTANSATSLKPRLSNPTAFVSTAPSKVEQPTAVDVSATATFFSSDDPDTSNIASVSSVASCSMLADVTPADAHVLQSLFTLLGSKELSRSRPALLRRADEKEAQSTCSGWSHDAFRQALAFLDVRVCAALLRLSRTRAHTLDANEVDRLCRVWLHAVTHCTPVDGAAAAAARNVTGPRRLVTAAATTTVPAVYMSPSPTHAARSAVMGEKAVAQRLPVEALAPASKNVWDVGDQDGYLSAPSSALVVSSDVSNACTDISMTSLSSESLLPREDPPQPTAADSRRTLARASCERPVAETESTLASQQRQLMADAVYRQRSRQGVFQQWCTSLRHRWQTRIAAAYIRDKVEEATMQRRRPALRSPSWSGLLRHVTYLERKRGFFNYWRSRAEERLAARAAAVEKRGEEGSDVAACRTPDAAASSLSSQPCAEENPMAASTRLCTKRALFTAWKLRAEAKTLLRCSAARARVQANAPQTPDTFLTLRRRSAVARRERSVPSTLPSPVAARRLLEDLLNTGEKGVSSPPLPVSPAPSLGFRRCNLSDVAPMNASTWQSAAKPAGVVAQKVKTSLAEEEGLSPVAPSSSDGISVNSVTTPYLPTALSTPPRDVSAAAVATGGGACPARHDAEVAQRRHELTSPPEIRILFPTDSTAPSSLSPRPFCTHAAAAAAAAVAACGRSAVRLYAGRQPSLLPSTTAARRAIRTGTATRGSQPNLMAETPLPYPVEDVEALVARSRQLEADRAFLLSEVRKLSTERERHQLGEEEGLANGRKAVWNVSAQDGLEERCAVQTNEIRRLEAIVAALRNERRDLLSSVRHGIFQY